MWQEAKRPREENEPPLKGPMLDWVNKVQVLRDEADLARMRDDDPVLRELLARSGTPQPEPA
jgi:hypothetical protein